MVSSTAQMDIGQLSDWFENRPINKLSRAKLAQHIQQRLNFVGVEWANPSTHVRMLDYACGPGFLSRIFAPHVSSITAIDASQQMIDRYNARIHELGDTAVQAHKGNLFESPPSPASIENDTYHLITIGQALHFFPDAQVAVKRLVERLRPGGVLFVQDVFDEGRDEGSRGFRLDKLRELMSVAGLVEFRFEVLPEELDVELVNEDVVRVKYFVARGVKMWE